MPGMMETNLTKGYAKEFKYTRVDPNKVVDNSLKLIGVKNPIMGDPSFSI